jgi:hypothetical protein
MFRRRATALLWIAVFDHLYGLRLLIRTGTFARYAGASQTALLTWILRPAPIPSRDLTLIRTGAGAVSLAAVADNLRG